MGRLDNGQIVMLPRTVPEDRVLVRRLALHKGTVWGTSLEVMTPSPHRVIPPCPHADRCGGCDFMHIEESRQGFYKSHILEQALRRTAGDPPRPPTEPIVKGEASLGYRSRLRLHVSESGMLGFREGASHRHVPVSQCAVADERINSVLREVGRAGWPDRKSLMEIDQVEIRVSDSSPTILLRLWPRPRPQKMPRALTIAASLGVLGKVVVQSSIEDATVSQRYPLSPGAELWAPASAFTQVNPVVNRMLIKAIVSGAEQRQLGSFVDAYAGAGNFTLPLLAAGLSGIAIDSEPSGIEAAKKSAHNSLLTAGEFLVGDAGQMLNRMVQQRHTTNLVVLDPPRQGARNVLPEVLRLRPRTIALVACDPVTLARDLGTLVSAGGRIEQLIPFDMFPHTHHVESLAWVGFS
jgi:23S rRNA (uracil1939-C5)-methyltransferase